MPLPPLAPAVIRTPTIRSEVRVILARWVAPVTSDGTGPPDPNEVISDGAVAIDTERILGVGPRHEIQAQYPEGTVIDLSQSHLLIPGLVNCHTHCAMSLLRGYADDICFSDWLEHYIWPTERAMVTDDFVYEGTKIAFVEALKSGTTMVNDAYFLPEAAGKAIQEAGIRCVHGITLIDRANAPMDAQLQEALRFIKKTQAETTTCPSEKARLVRPSLIPHAVYTVPETSIRQGCAVVMAMNKEMPTAPVTIHTHLHETVDERRVFEQLNFGKSPFQVLDEAGAVNPFLVAAHCVHMTDDDIHLLAERKANVSHCPKSNMKLACGFCPVWKMLQAGVNVCLGTDGGCSNNSVDMLSEMQYASLLAKVATGNAAALNAYTVLRMATRNGARALGRLHDLGSLEVGKLADITAVDIVGHDYLGLPVHDPLSHLVYTTHPRVTDVWIGGRRVVENGVVQTIRINPQCQKHLLSKLNAVHAQLRK